MRASANAVVLPLKNLRSWRIRAGMPPMGRAWKAGFFSTIPVRAWKMVGSIASTEARID
jgi:hypothetical protein